MEDGGIEQALAAVGSMSVTYRSAKGDNEPRLAEKWLNSKGYLGIVTAAFPIPLKRGNRALGLSSRVFEELASVAHECRDANWDGFGSAAVTQDTLHAACCFLEALPLGFPAPSIGAEPDGQLTLEWHLSARCTLSISVGPDRELHYAALSGSNRDYGTDLFSGDIPESILANIRRVYGG
jgi:hypothetical protein